MQSRARGGDDLRTATIDALHNDFDPRDDRVVRLYHKLRAPRAYDLNNCVVRRAVSDALKLQGAIISLGEVQAYVLESLGIKPAKKELDPIVEALLYEEERQAMLRKKTIELDRVQAAGHHGHGLAILTFQCAQLAQFGVQWPDASPFDGVTKISGHNAWRYETSMPTLHKYRDRATRTPDSEPGRFYRQVMCAEWDGKSTSYNLARSRLRKLAHRSRALRGSLGWASVSWAVPAAVSAGGGEGSLSEGGALTAAVSAADAPTAAETVTPAAETTASLAHLQPPPSLPPSPPDTDGEEGSESEGAEGSNAASEVERQHDAFAESMRERHERQRAEHAERQRQLPPECLIDHASLYKLENRALEARLLANVYDESIDNFLQVPEWLEGQRRLFNGTTRITADNAESFEDNLDFQSVPSLKEYRNQAKRTPDSLPARFYRMVMGEEWDGEAHSYSLARKKFWRLLPHNRQDERERQQRKKRDYSKKRRPADDNARRQARRDAQRERQESGTVE